MTRLGFGVWVSAFALVAMTAGCGSSGDDAPTDSGQADANMLTDSGALVDQSTATDGSVVSVRQRLTWPSQTKPGQQSLGAA